MKPEAANDPARRRTVATRVLLSFAFVTAVFALVAGWGVFAQRSAAREAELIRSGYMPLSLRLRDLRRDQDIWNSQLNHITTAKNPADLRVYFDAALSPLGRPKSFGETRAAISRARPAPSRPARRSRAEAARACRRPTTT